MISQRISRRDRRSGQTTVEYILLAGAIVGFVVGVKNLVIKQLAERILPSYAQSVQTEAPMGGRANAGYYYVKSKALAP